MTKSEARKFLKNQVYNLWLSLRDLSLDELMQLKEVNDNYSETNCWFAEHQMKQGVANLLNDRIADFDGTKVTQMAPK